MKESFDRNLDSNEVDISSYSSFNAVKFYTDAKQVFLVEVIQRTSWFFALKNF